MTTRKERILLTGSSGRLGTELRRVLADVAAPSEEEMDITSPEAIAAALRKYRPGVLVHAAAYTDVAGADGNRQQCWAVNVDGTRNIVQATIAQGIFLVHISTDYVFDGARGGYKEDDTLGPVLNYYSLTKLVAEQLVRMNPHHLVIRTSFRAKQWPYPNAFTDLYTSQDYVDVIAPEIALAIRRCGDIPFDTVHVATERKTAYELARRRRPDVTPSTRDAVSVRLPDDISLDVSRWQNLKTRWSDNG